MKYRLTALVALAAIVALPAVASAATMDDSSGYTPITPYPTVRIPTSQNVNAPSILFHTEHKYLATVCPTVSQNPANYSGVLDRFCREYQG